MSFFSLPSVNENQEGTNVESAAISGAGFSGDIRCLLSPATDCAFPHEHRVKNLLYYFTFGLCRILCVVAVLHATSI
jgi:hypothetical protein